jgi:hypothetical protein
MKFISKYAGLLSLLIIFPFFLQACQKAGKKVIFENPCALPCWQYITPGQTDQEELIRTLKSQPDVDQRSIRILGKWNIFDSYVVVRLKSKIKINIYLINDKVILISIYDNFGMTYAEAVDHFGEPDVITAARTLGSDFIPIGDLQLLYISSMIPEVGIAFGFSSKDILMKSDEQINLDSRITNFYYYDPESFKTLLDRGLFTDGNTWDFQYWRSNDK